MNNTYYMVPNNIPNKLNSAGTNNVHNNISVLFNFLRRLICNFKILNMNQKVSKNSQKLIS